MDLRDGFCVLKHRLEAFVDWSNFYSDEYCDV